MDTSRLVRKSETEWWIMPFGEMSVPGIICATDRLIRDMDDKVFEQVSNVARLR
jgi:tRNA-splicing ligase RtcB